MNEPVPFHRNEPVPFHPPGPPGEGWTQLPAEALPAPTFWPAGLALGITLAFWGLISSVVIGGAGLGLMAVSLAGWIRQMRHERPHAP
jgi:hypothetical protein